MFQFADRYTQVARPRRVDYLYLGHLFQFHGTKLPSLPLLIQLICFFIFRLFDLI